MSHRIQQQDAIQYMLSGRAHVTLHNIQTGNQYAYLIKRKAGKDLWWVYHASNYIGFIRNNSFTAAGDSVANPKAIQVFNWIWIHLILGNLPENVHILHDGTCGRCGRQLTDAHSINTGIGPECRKKLGIPITHYDSTNHS